MGVNNRVEAISGINASYIENVASVRNSTEAMPPSEEIHRVSLPPNKTTCQKLKHRLSEIFFPDDPLHKFKNQTPFKKLLLGFHFFFPILQWAPDYSLKLLNGLGKQL